MSEQNNTIGSDTGLENYTVVVVDDEPTENLLPTNATVNNYAD